MIIKKHIILFMIMMLPMVAMADKSGSCGVSVTYMYVEATHTLTISGTGKMTNYIVKSSNPYAPWSGYRNEIENLIIEEGVTSVGDFAFFECRGLTSIIIPNSVISIGGSTFQGCKGLSSVTIPNNVKSIGGHAFAYCDKLSSVTIPNSVTTIGKSAFFKCSSLTSITIPNSVRIIGDYAFECCSLTSITIPNSVNSIGSNPFSDCSGLSAIYVESGNRKYDSRNGCNAIIETSTNKLISGCKNTIIPNSVTSIGGSAFYNCSCLTSVTIPNGVTSIGENAFDGCSGLTSVTIPNSLTGIDHYAFRNCSGLTSIIIPNSVTIIGQCAFLKCNGLTSITIGNGVSTIYKDAFAYCPKLTDVYCYAVDVPYLRDYFNEIVKTPFYGSNIEYATLHVPMASIDDYKRVEPWRNFKEVVAITDNNPSKIKEAKIIGDDITSTIDLNGKKNSLSDRGLKILKTKNGRAKKIIIKK